MDRRGLASASVLWIASLVSALALSALIQVRLLGQAANHRVRSVQALALAQAAAVLSHATGFSEPVVELATEHGSVRAVRYADQDGRLARLACEVAIGRYRKEVEIEWRRVGSVWRAHAWREKT